MGLNGLALATTISAVFSCVTLYVMLRKHIGDFGLKSMLITILKSAISCAVMAVAVILVQNYLISALPELVGLIVCVLAGVIAYFGCAFAIRIEPLKMLISELKAKFIKKKN